ncbi:MAG: hypothetical protein AAFO07_07810 [Bacteroidota bacterium]
MKKTLIMASTNELITLINKFSLTERLKIVEEVLRGIREEKSIDLEEKAIENFNKPRILELAGIYSEEEANEFSEAVDEARKIDDNEW